MNTRNVKQVLITFLVVMLIATSFETSQSANRNPVSPPVSVSTSPQPLETGISILLLPRSQPSTLLYIVTFTTISLWASDGMRSICSNVRQEGYDLLLKT